MVNRVSMIPWFPGEVEVPTDVYGAKFQPKKMVFLEIGIEMDDDGHIKVRYSHKGKKRNAPSASNFESEIKKHLLRFPGRRRNRARTIQHSGETPMSINAEKSRLVMLKLSENNNLQFNQVGSPISVAVGSTDHFSGVCKIDNEANLIRSTDLMNHGPDPHCKHALFAVDASTTPKRFNIHLDLVEYDDNGDVAYTIPIIIDPDVRHPGGDDG